VGFDTMLATFLYGYAWIGLGGTLVQGSNQRQQLSLIALTMVVLCVGTSLMCLGVYVTLQTSCWSWSILDIPVELTLDRWMGLILYMLAVIAGTILLYTEWYAKGEGTNGKLVAYLAIFTCGMCLLILATDAVTLMLGWELIGTCSYLLIGFYATRSEAAKSSLKAVTVNRIGDVGMLLMVVVGVWLYGDARLSIWLACGSCLPGTWGSSAVLLMGTGGLLGLYAKSAQFGMHTWLLDAMEGPTPVSALLHSATLVTAGTIVMCKLEGVWRVIPGTAMVLALVGTTSALLAALLAVVQLDVKRTVALSTCTHVGLMVLALGAGSGEWCCEHLYVHGWIKSTLFMCMGVGIHSIHSQDPRAMGGLGQAFPTITSISLIVVLAVSGLPGSHMGAVKDLVVVVGGTETDSRVYFLAIACVVWLSQGYAAGSWMSVWHEASRVGSAMTVSLGLRSILLALTTIGCMMPSVLGDWSSWGRAGYLELGDVSTWLVYDPLGLALVIGIGVGNIRASSSSHQRLHPRSVSSFSGIQYAAWQRLGIDKLVGSMASLGSNWALQHAQRDADQGVLGGIPASSLLVRGHLHTGRLAAPLSACSLATLTLVLVQV